jgi:hypothetical protein
MMVAEPIMLQSPPLELLRPEVKALHLNAVKLLGVEIR